ncbi:MAG: hypothetical protein IJC63_02970, partial [Myxococcaceae bacterium]|nr:hypothetical protein [Myxococcaceae bacterium]
ADLATLQVKLSMSEHKLEEEYAALGRVAYKHFTEENNAADEVAKFFEAVKFDVVREPLLNQFVPKAECLEACREAGRALAEEALRRAKAADPAN